VSDEQPPELSVSAHPTGSAAVVLAVAGVIDFGSEGLLYGELAARVADGTPRLVLDLAGVELCDSSGLGMLVRGHRLATAHGGWLRLAAPQPLVRDLLAITNLDRLLPVYDDVDAALHPAD
jgi:anti-anti-sigma factor